MTFRTTPIIAAALVIGLASGAQARDHGPKFADLDTNSDGQLSTEELKAHGAAHFTKMDENGDGFLTQEEIEAQGKRRAAKRARRMIKHLDANEDGKLSQDEMAAGAERRMGKMMEHLDADKNGSISEEEFEAGHKKGKRHHGKHGDKHMENE